jgi:uncharacterized protein (DUF4213/DUF364 family)
MKEQTIQILLEKLRGHTDDLPALLNSPVEVKSLTAVEAIGNPGGWDYPLLRGKEVLLQATFINSIGQAFTGVPKTFHGTLDDVFNLNLEQIENRAILVATINALLRNCGLIEKTVHCRDNEPAECGLQIAAHLYQEYGPVRVGLAGYQPAFIKALTEIFDAKNVCVTDLSAENVGKIFSGTEIWDGMTRTEELIAESDLILVTGSVFVNNTMGPFLAAVKAGKQLYFYGTTVTGLAYLHNLPHICLLGH